MLSKSLFECSFSHAYVVFPGCVFVCCHFSVVDNVSGEAVVVQGAINALYFVHRAPYGGEDSTLYVIYIYIYIYIIDYKMIVYDALIIYVCIYVYIYIYICVYTYVINAS